MSLMLPNYDKSIDYAKQAKLQQKQLTQMQQDVQEESKRYLHSLQMLVSRESNCRYLDNDPYRQQVSQINNRSIFEQYLQRKRETKEFQKMVDRIGDEPIKPECDKQPRCDSEKEFQSPPKPMLQPSKSMQELRCESFSQADVVQSSNNSANSNSSNPDMSQSSRSG